jgi:hypothetical protein
MADFSGLVAYCCERESIRLKKQRGDSPPWTSDPVLAEYRLSSASPWQDGTSKRLLRVVESAGLLGATEQFQVGLLVGLRSSSFSPLCELAADHPPVNLDEFAAIVRTIVTLHKRATTPVFSRNGPPFRVVLEPAQAAMRIPVSAYTGVEAAFRLFRELPWLDGFTGYLCARDLTATKFLAMPPDPDWCYPGPGCRKGLARCGASQNLAGVLAARDALAGKVPSWMFDVHDTQHVLCEFNRWARAVEGGRMPRVRYKGGPREPRCPLSRTITYQEAIANGQ